VLVVLTVRPLLLSTLPLSSLPLSSLPLCPLPSSASIGSHRFCS
jgi:hypothetical protein